MLMLVLLGFPSHFNTVDEVVKFITMVIFRVSVQHAAVNNGQVGNYYLFGNFSKVWNEEINLSWFLN